MKKQDTALIYCRVSSVPQAKAKKFTIAGEVREDAGDTTDDSSTKDVQMETSLDTQQAACERLAKERGWDVENVHTDVYSGANLHDRPGLTALRERLAKGGIQHVIVYAQDRLSRSM